MKPEAQRIAIAKACGWKPSAREIEIFEDSEIEAGHYKPRGLAGRAYFGMLPDYLNDLNAMQEAEEVAITKDILDMKVGRLFKSLKDVTGLPYPFRATAAQRAEAFLKTIGKWEVAQ